MFSTGVPRLLLPTRTDTQLTVRKVGWMLAWKDLYTTYPAPALVCVSGPIALHYLLC